LMAYLDLPGLRAPKPTLMTQEEPNMRTHIGEIKRKAGRKKVRRSPRLACKSWRHRTGKETPPEPADKQENQTKQGQEHENNKIK